MLKLLAITLIIISCSCEEKDPWKIVDDLIAGFIFIPNMAVSVSTPPNVRRYHVEKGHTTMQTVMPVASASKWFSGVTILKYAVEQANADLDAPLHTYIPWWTNDPSDRRYNVTLRNALSFIDGYCGYEGALEELCPNTNSFE